MMSGSEFSRIAWVDEDGAPVSCVAKLDVLTETLDELRDIAQDALEDAVLIGCSEAQVRSVLRNLIDGLVNPYRKD
jgi:hypothetical protein